jgi:hypothetical protein
MPILVRSEFSEDMLISLPKLLHLIEASIKALSLAEAADLIPSEVAVTV